MMTFIYKIIKQALSFAKKQYKIFSLTLPYLSSYQTTTKASALTYFTLLSIVPIVALIFAVAKNFGMETMLYQFLLKNLTGQEQVINWIINLANNILNKTKSGLIASIGLAILFWAVIRLFINMENSFNDIWQVKHGRSFNKKITDYVSIIIISPIILVLSISFTIYMATQIESFLKNIQYLGVFIPVARVLFNLIPYFLIWILFSILFKAMPYTYVRFDAAFVAGIVAGSMFQITQWLYVKFQIGVSNFNALYGSFAALPLFMIWVQTSWLIVIFGAHYCYTYQNYKNFEYEKEIENISESFKYAISAYILNFLICNYLNEKPVPTVENISEKLKLPSRLVRKVLIELEEINLIARVIISDKDITGYIPAKDVHAITLAELIIRLNKNGINTLPISEETELIILQQNVEKIYEQLNNFSSNILIKDILPNN